MKTAITRKLRTIAALSIAKTLDATHTPGSSNTMMSLLRNAMPTLFSCTSRRSIPVQTPVLTLSYDKVSWGKYQTLAER